MQDTAWTVTGTGYEPRSVRSASSSTHRPDLRWGRLTFAHLRDEEFLAKQLRRLEITQGARRAGRPTPDVANVTGLAPVKTIRQRLLTAQTKASRGASEDEDFDTKEETLADVAAVDRDADDRHERELTNALCVLGNLQQPELAALVVAKLKDALQRNCTFPNPVYQLIALRRQLMKSMHEAVAAQHRQRKAAEQLNLAITKCLETGPSSDATSALPVDAAGVLSGSTTVKPKEKVAREAALGIQVLVCLLGDLHDPGVATLAQRREFLEDLLPLLRTMGFLVLSPRRSSGGNLLGLSAPASRGSSRCLGPPGSLPGAADITEFTDKIQRFLLDLCPRPTPFPSSSPKLPAISSGRGELEVLDRTNAVNGLIHLAAATGSVRDFLVVLRVLLGASDHADPAVKELRSSLSSRSLLTSSVPSLATVRADELLPSPIHSSRDDDEVTQVKLTVRPDSSRGSPRSKRETEDSAVQDPLRRKTILKGIKTGTNGGGATVSLAMSPSSSLHHRLLYSRPGNNLVNKQRAKEELKDVLLGNASLSLDMSKMKGDTAASAITTRSETPVVTARCPKFKALDIRSVLVELHGAKPTAPTRTSRTKPTSSFHGGYCSNDSSVFAGDEDEGDREVWSCGQNSYGELGHGDTASRKSFERIESLQQRDIVQVGAGNEHTIALTADGKVLTCGYNDNGQCGHGGTARVSHLSEMPKLGDKTITQVHAYNGCEHTILVTMDGRAATCGYNYRGQLGHGNTASESVPKMVRSLENRIVRLVSCSYYHTVMACEEDGGGQQYVYTFGRNDYGQLGHNDSIDRKVPQHIEALSDQQVVSVACGQYHTMVVTATGKAFAFGKNDYGQLGIDSMENQLVPVQVRSGLEKQECLEIRCGYYHSIVLCSGAHLFAFGRNDYGQLGLGRAHASSTANLQLQQQRYSYARLIEELEGKDIVRLACGCYHTVAVSDNGVMYVFGRNNHGQLGTGDTNERVYPFPLDDFVGKRVALVAAGFYHTVVLTGGKDDDKNEQDAANTDEGSSGSALNGVTFSSILSTAAVQELVDPSKRPELDTSSAGTKAAASEDAPAIDPTEADFRDEDSLLGDSGSASNLPSDSTDALFAAVVLMAQLDRLCQPFLPKPGSYPVLHHPTTGVIDSLVADSRASSAPCLDLSGVFEGSFEVFGVHNCSSTFDSIAVLLRHLSTRRFESASQLTASLVHVASATPRRSQPSSASQVQVYLLVACIRLLQANLSQLLRSGMAKAVILLSQDAIATTSGRNPATKELDRTRVALLQIRELLLALVDMKHRTNACCVLENAPSEGANAARVADEATATLMHGFELFFPCQCLQRQFFMSIMREPSSHAPNCGALCRRALWSVAGFPKSNSILLEPLLRRVADDSVILRFVPLEAATFPARDGQEGSVAPVTAVYQVLLERVAADFTRRLGQAAAARPSSAVRPRQDSTSRAFFDTLGAIQKHLSSWAASAHEWVLKEKTGVATSVEARVASVVDRCFRVDERDLEHVPIAWRCFIEFALATMGQCCEVLGQLLSMESIPSPTHSYDHAGLPENSLRTKTLETAEHSILGQLLPLLVVSLFEFSNKPLFAAALLPTVKSLLQQLDGLNSRDSAALDAERSFVESVASSVCPRPTQRESGGSFRRQSDGNSLGSARDEDGNSTTRKTLATANAMALPWHFRLEKELAVLAAEMAVTLVIGDPFFVFEHQEKLSPRWVSSPLFHGGLSSKYVTQSIRHGGSERSADSSRHARVVEHSPFPTATAALPAAMGFRLQPFSLILPPPPVQHDTEPRWTLPTAENYGELFRSEAVRGFLSSLQGQEIADASHQAASKLCDWVRDSYAKRDASYRMIMRQSQLSMKLKASSASAERSVHEKDFKLEAAFFAVLLHHNGLASQAFHFALAMDRSNADTRASPPRAFLSLWHCVAQLRRRVASKKTEINNAPDEASESPRSSATERILALQQTMVDRCELLRLADVYDEQQHLNLELDAGFIAPWDPGFLVSASSSFPFSAPSAKRHLHASYTDERLPFLAAFPASKWRKVRVLLHTVIRWKAVATEFQTDRQAISQEALAFVTSDDAVSSTNAISALLVDPCRRVSCSVRGLESLWELVTLVSFDSIHVDIVHQVTQVFVFQTSVHSILTGSRNVGYFYSSLESETFAEFASHLTAMMTDKAAELLESGEAEATARFWIVIALLSVWGIHFTAEQFEFVSDVGILGLLQELLRGLSSKRATAIGGESSSTIPSVDSIVGRSGPLAPLAVQKHLGRLEETLWVVFRYILVHCAVQNVETTQQQVLVPSFPVLSGVAELLYTEAAFLSSPLLPLQAGDSTDMGTMGSSIPVAPGAIRRSFEAITSPRRFSCRSKDLTISYDDMISPSGSEPSTPMSPLLKPNEFSVTTWMYINTCPAPRAQTADGDVFSVSLELPDRQLVFLRGAGREVSLYVLLVPESADNWQLEAGILMGSNRDAEAGELTDKSRMWERVQSKQVVAGGRWLHVAVVLEATKLRLYLNGVLDCQRSLAAPSIAVWAAGSGELPLHFGRFPTAEKSVVSAAIGFLTRSLGIVTGAGWDQAMALSNNVPTRKAAAFRGLDGWLCRFRFHNRSLSPIHVRIVFDEKKSPLSSVTDAALDTTVKVVELHALLLVLTSSSEGLVHFSSQYSKWMRLLWGTFLGSNSALVQQSALRVLGALIPLQHPLEASKVLVQDSSPAALGFYCLEDVFVQQVIRMIGFCVTKCPQTSSLADATVVPWSLMVARGIHANQFSPQVRGSSEQQSDVQNDVERQYQSSKRQCSLLANELCQLLQQLFRGSNGAWRQSITSVTSRLSQHFSSGQDDREQLDLHVLEFGNRCLSRSAIRRVESRGSFLFLGGVVEFLRPGVAVEMRGSSESAQVLSLQYNTASPSSPETSSGAKQSTQDTMAFVHIDNNSKAVEAAGSTWYERVFDCESFPFCSKVNVDELKQTEASSPNVGGNTQTSILYDVALQGSDKEVLKVVVDKANEVIPAVYRSKGQKTRSCELSAGNAGCLLLQILVQVAGTSAGVDELLAKPELVEAVAELAVRQDGNPKHETLRRVQNKVSALRREVYTVLVELGEAGEAELESWDEASDVLPFKTESRPGSRGLSTARRSFVLSQDDAGSLSEAGLADAEDDGPANENWDPAMGDDEPNTPMQDEEDEEDEEDDESLEDVDNDEDEDEEVEEARAEFVEELMLMGFPEDWCVLALKQTENEIVSASAWIVDNLEYLSKLQSTLDQECDKGRDSPRFDEEVDDVLADDTRSNRSQPPPLNSSNSWTQLVVSSQLSDVGGGKSPVNPSLPGSEGGAFTAPPLNDKEMGRKLFGEMYFPFEDGGFLSNTKSRFMRSWRSDAIEMKGKTSPPEPINDTTAETPPLAFDEDFSTELGLLDIREIMEQLGKLERTLSILYARQFMATLLYQTTSSQFNADTSPGLRISYAQWFQLQKLVLLRGDQFNVVVTRANSTSSQLQEVSVDDVFSRAFRCFYDRDAATFTATAFEFCLESLDAAASSKNCEAVLWTQRDLQRPDRTVTEEPCVEVAVWLLDLLLIPANNTFCSLAVSSGTSVLRRLRCCLGTTNLPLKFVVLRTISRLLSASPTSGNVADEAQLVASDFLTAATMRHSRELVQGRLLFSQYLQGYVELLHVLLQRTSGGDTSVTRPLLPRNESGEGLLHSAVSLLPPSAPTFPSTEGSSLLFDRKRSRSSLLAFAGDGLSVSYSGNEVWKAACAVVAFSTGVHSWSVRIDKSTSPYLFVGVAARQAKLDSFLGADDQSWGFIGDKALYYQRNRVRAYGETFTEGDCIGLRLDCEKGELSFSKNGVDLGLAFDNIVGEVCPAVAFYSRHQKISFVKDSCVSLSGTSGAPIAASGEDGAASVQDCLTACEILHNWVDRKPMRAAMAAAAFKMTTEWLVGSTKCVSTRSGKSLWVDVTRDACGKLGFYADDRVRSPRGNGVVVGVAGGRVWVEVDNEPGAWFFHPSKLRVVTMASATSSSLPVPPENDSSLSEVEEPSEGTAQSEAPSPPFSLSSEDLVEYGQHPLWSLAVDRELLSVVNEFCEVSQVSPWNLTPSDLLRLVKEKTSVLELTCAGSLLAMPQTKLETLVVARFALLRFGNMYVSRSLPFFDLTWLYFQSDSNSLPCRLVSRCRGSLFVCVKNALWTALMEKTANSPKRADDEYDYPEDLPQLQVNRLKAAAAKCHEGSVSSLFSSLFGQAFEELHFLPLKTLRMVYSHPMDDGQLRSFKVKFEGEGVDDYGGPYREFFSQFFAELQMLHVPESENPSNQTVSGSGPSSTSLKLDPGMSVSACVLPFLMPSPNWRNGVGANREKFVLNGALISGDSDKTATISSPGESAEEKRQLYCEMFFFLGQMIGTCLRTRVCVRLDLAMSVWKQLVAEDASSPDNALETLKEIDFVAYSLWKTLRGVLDEFKRLPTRRQDLEEQLEAMDLTFTTVLSDGRTVELCEDGSDTIVTLLNLERYLDAMLRARVQETREVLNIIKQGLHSIMPVSALALLTWTELERRMCGVAEVDVKLLQANTEYDEELSPTDEFIQRFWRVLASLESEDKRAFLRFVWARSRLPLGSAQFHQKFKIQALASSGTGDGATTGGWMDSQMPKSHTCFFALQLPRYSSDEICRERLLYAVRNCVEMDGDFRLADTEMTGWTGISPTDQLRI